MLFRMMMLLVEEPLTLLLASLVMLVTASLIGSKFEKKKETKRWPKKVIKLNVANNATEWQFSVKPPPGTVDLEIVGDGKGRSLWTPGSGGDKCQSYPFDRNQNKNACDLVYRNNMLKQNPERVKIQGTDAASASLRGAAFYSRLQTEDGFWPGDYGGPMFLLPGMVIACYVTGVDLGEARRGAMLRYIMNHQHDDDGGWGTHIEGVSTMFGSSLNYTAARLLGLEKTDPRAVKARAFMHKYQGATSAPQWAKFWLSTLGVYEWTGVNPTPPELWLLPYWFPFHPGRMWCHCRMVYLPMSALFGDRYVYEHASTDPLTVSLRQELYPMKYETISWGSFSVRERIAPMDLYNPQSHLMTAANHILHNTLENPIIRKLFHYPLNYLREKALKFAHSYIHAEDVHTNWINIGPVSKAFQIITNYSRFGPDAPEFLRHVARIDDYLWLAEDGLKMQGYNGSMFWDTCFAAHAMAATLEVTEKSKKGVEVVEDALRKTAVFVDDMQVREDVWERHSYFRDVSTGGWPFSSRDHGWPISDCTAEGVMTSIILREHPNFRQIPQERIEQGISIILGLQNMTTDKGWASYELNRGYNWYELLNPAQVFGDIMIDYSYVECSSSCVQALCEFAATFPKSDMTPRALTSARYGVDFILSKQRKDGSFYGSWGVCFTYGGWFAVDGIVAALTHAQLTNIGKYQNALVKSCRFMLSKQNKTDGGWGESVESCSVKEWVPCEQGSQVVQTAWVLLSLTKTILYLKKFPLANVDVNEFEEAAHKAAAFLKNRQLPDGDWAQECVSGVFNKTCAISYTAYRNVFPFWALAEYSKIEK